MKKGLWEISFRLRDNPSELQTCVVAGKNERGAKIRLRKKLNKEGLRLKAIEKVEPWPSKPIFKSISWDDEFKQFFNRMEKSKLWRELEETEDEKKKTNRKKKKDG